MDPALSQTAGLLAAAVVMAFFFAKVEIHIEGPHGWATSLPTWRIERHRLLDWFFGGRAMTGYHAWMLPFMALAFHFPAVATWSWSWALEARMLAAMFVFWIVEDLLWFVLNPAWGLRRFTPREATWHKRWLLGAPVDYWVFALLAAGLLWWAAAS